MIQIGSIINKRYKLIDKIGIGGMATVYMARDIQTGETFAVKIMSTLLCFINAVENQREAMANSKE